MLRVANRTTDEFMGWLGIALWIVFFIAVGVDVWARDREHKARAKRRSGK